MDHKPPTAVIESAHREHLSTLPFDDTGDFDDADRGFIAALEPVRGQGRRRPGRVGQRRLRIPRRRRADIGAPQPVAAVELVRQAGSLRGRRGHLPGPRPRPVQHQLHRGRHRHHRHRPADLHRDGRRRPGPVPHAPRGAPRRRGDLHPQPRRPLRRRARRHHAGRRRRGQGRGARAGRLHRHAVQENVYAGPRWRGGPATCTAPCSPAGRRDRSAAGSARRSSAARSP